MKRYIKQVTVIAAAALTAGGSWLAFSQPASAGAGSPPITNGSVTYRGASLVISCSGGKPSSASFSFTYDATRLMAPYALSVEADASDPSFYKLPDNPTFEALPGQVGTYQHTFSLASVPAGLDEIDVGVYASNGYDYVYIPTTLTCPGPSIQSSFPSATVSPLDCTGHATVTLDNWNSDESYGWVVYLLGQGFIPEQSSIPARGILTQKITGTAGETIELGVDNQNGSGDLGQFTFTNGCVYPPVPARSMSDPGGLTEQVVNASGECFSWTMRGYGPGAPVTVIAYPRLTRALPTDVGTFYANANGRVTVSACLSARDRGSYTLLAAGDRRDGSIMYQKARTIVQPY